MSELDPHIPTPPVEAEAKRRSRLRWITLGEAIAVAAVIISGLGLYNSWQDRRSAEAEATKTLGAKPLVLHAAAEGEGSRLDITSANDGHIIQSQHITFPAALNIAPVETTGNSRIEAGWIEGAVKDAKRTDAHNGGDQKLPVLIRTDYLDNGVLRSSSAIYDLGYTVSERFLLGGTLKLHGLSLISQSAGAKGQKRIDVIWAGRNPPTGK